jgi:tetratricopeptide (TPR) repeat protein
MRRSVASVLLISFAIAASGCGEEAVRRKAEELRQAREDREAEERMYTEFKAAQQAGDDKDERQRQACRQAFRLFERAQSATDARAAEALYREGLAMCPEDEVGHFELGRLLAESGKSGEARREFEAALEINPDFRAARQELEQLR